MSGLKIEITTTREGKVIPVHGLLADYLYAKCECYVAPTRKGTPHGQPVGFPTQKYGATLFALTSFPHLGVAKKLQISYTLLRKWRSETAFKKMVEEHSKEFADLFIRRIQERIAVDHADTENLLKLTPSKLATTQVIGRRRYDEFNDGQLYGDVLIGAIWKRYQQLKRARVSDGGTTKLFVECEVLWVLDWIDNQRGKPTPFMDRGKEELRPTLRALVNNSLRLLTAPKLSTSDRKTAILLLTLVSHALGQEHMEKGGSRRKERR